MLDAAPDPGAYLAFPVGRCTSVTLSNSGGGIMNEPHSSRGAAGARPALYRTSRFCWILVAVLLLPVVAAFSADVPIATIPVGDAPVSIAVNSISHRIYVANYYGSTVSVIDGVSDTVTSTVVTGDFTVPIAVVANPIAIPARAYVANFWSNAITVIDESTNAATATVPSNGVHAGGPRALALNPSGPNPKLYVADYGSGLVTVLDALDYHQIAAVPVGGSPRALGIFSSLPRTRVYVANRASNTVSIIDGDIDQVVATVPSGVAPKAIAVDDSTGHAYVSNEGNNTVTVIDDTDAVLATIEVGARPVGIAVDENLGRLFVANYDAGTVSVVRTSDLTHEATLTVGAQPWAIAVDAADGKAFVTNYGSNTASVIDSTLSVTTVPCGTNPYSVAVDAGAVPHKTYVGNWNSDNVTVIDEPAAAVGLGAFAVPEAYAANSPVYVSISPTLVDTGETLMASGGAESMRVLYPAAISAVFYRVVPDIQWQRAEIVTGGGTEHVMWSADLGQLSDAACQLEVIALDQTSAAASVSDGGTSVRASSAGGFASAAVQLAPPEPHSTQTLLTVQYSASRKARPVALLASVACATEDCAGATGVVVFEVLDDGEWQALATVPLSEGSAEVSVKKTVRGTFRARYMGDASHDPSVSGSVVLKPSAMKKALLR